MLKYIFGLFLEYFDVFLDNVLVAIDPLAAFGSSDAPLNHRLLRNFIVDDSFHGNMVPAEQLCLFLLSWKPVDDEFFVLTE